MPLYPSSLSILHVCFFFPSDFNHRELGDLQKEMEIASVCSYQSNLCCVHAGNDRALGREQCQGDSRSLGVGSRVFWNAPQIPVRSGLWLIPELHPVRSITNATNRYKSLRVAVCFFYNAVVSEHGVDTLNLFYSGVLDAIRCIKLDLRS